MSATHRRSHIEVELGSPRARVLMLRCAAPGSLQPQPRAMLRLNGRRVGVLRLARELREARFVLSADLQREGENTIEIVNPRLAATPRRRQAEVYERIACTHLSIEDAVSGAIPPRPRPTLAAAGDRILLPGSARIAYFAKLAAEPAIEIDLAFSAGERGVATLEVESAEHSAQWSVPVGARKATRTGIDLGDFAHQQVRITLRNSAGTDLRVTRGVVTSAAPPLAPPPGGISAPRPPGLVLLFVIDTLRADHLGTYGYPRATSPHIDRLASQALVFENVVAQSSWTTPATASILTGVTPPVHGAEHLSERMRKKVPSLAESLRRAGWRTGAFVTNTNVRSQLGFGRGFDAHRLLLEEASPANVHSSALELIDEALVWLDKSPRSRTFLYLHPSDPHGPYNPPAPFRGRFAPADASPELIRASDPLKVFRSDPKYQTDADHELLVARYDEEIAFTDAAFGRLRRELEERGLWEDALVLVTADHGEEFFDHGGVGHGRTLYTAQLHVPLLLRVPGMAPGRRAELVRQIDIAPTVLDAVGEEPPAGMEGRSLLAGDTATVALSHSFLGASDLAARTDARHRFIQRRDRDGRIHHEVYDLLADPGETVSLLGEDPLLDGWLRQSLRLERLRSLSAARGEEEPRILEVDEATRRRLEALGYLAPGRSES
jgi:arylsulfatase A-like enzyme